MGGRLVNVLIPAILAVLLVLPAFAAAAQVATPEGTPGADAVVLPDPAAPETGPVQAQRTFRLALLVAFPEDPYWQRVRTAAVERAALDGVTLDVLELSSPSVPEQLAQIDQIIAAGYDGILLGAVDAAGIAPGVVAANKANIAVLAIDMAPAGGSVISVVRTDDVAATRLAGQFIGQELDGEGNVLNIQGLLQSPVAQARDQGLREGLAEFPGVSVISSDAKWGLGNAYGVTLAQLPQAGEGTPTPLQPLVDAVFAAGPAMASGAATAVEDVEADTVIVVGYGATTETLKDIRSGLLEGVVAEYPSRAGAIAVDLMIRHLNGESVPPQYDSGFALVTRANLDQFIAAGA